MNNKTILIVDDTMSNLDILEELLSEYDVISAISGDDVFEILENENNIDLILLDIVMPKMDGFKICKILKGNQNTKDIPVIFITAKTDEESIEKAYDIGGADYVTKPFRPKELMSRVKKELKLQDVMSELKMLASIDHMTKLYNRRYFSQISSHILGLAKRNQQNISIIILDIDKFKNINDIYGHKVGDDAIIKLANILQNNKRTSDIVCRYGGDEFVILLPNTSIKGAKNVAKYIKSEIKDSCIVLENSEKLNFTISFGISSINIDKDLDIQHALKRADDALYKAKANGRDQIQIISYD